MRLRRVRPEQSRAVAVSRAYSVSVTCSVDMLWKKLITGLNTSSALPAHRGEMGVVSVGSITPENRCLLAVGPDSPELGDVLPWKFSFDSVSLGQW